MKLTKIPQSLELQVAVNFSNKELNYTVKKIIQGIYPSYEAIIIGKDTIRTNLAVIVSEKGVVTNVLGGIPRVELSPANFENDGFREELKTLIDSAILCYLNMTLDPFTLASMEVVAQDKNLTCTPCHFGGKGYDNAPAGIFFKQFYGKDNNIFKADTSVSETALGSLLDRSGVHKDAEKMIAKAYGASDAYMVTNGTSTANKIVANYSSTIGKEVIVDRNCHKSACHSLMRNTVKPLYLLPARNAYGILGGIPKSNFRDVLLGYNEDAVLPYGIITNSTYDGIFYKTQWIVDNIPVKNIHFDSAWVAYNAFNPMYKGLNGMSAVVPSGKTVFETQSTHKLGLSFSQASQILVKGEHNEKVLHESFMMDTSTSPFYPMVASIANSAKQLSSEAGKNMLQDKIDMAIRFRSKLKSLEKKSKGMIKVFQPDYIDNDQKSWEIKSGDSWHGFKNVDDDHLYLDPLKVTVLTKGIDNDKIISKGGIPAQVLGKFLEEKGIIPEKVSSYNLMFIIGSGMTEHNLLKIYDALECFIEHYKSNSLVEEVIPSLFNHDITFYKGMGLIDLCNGIHDIMVKYNLPEIMFKAFDILPKMEFPPFMAWDIVKNGHTEECLLKDILGKPLGEMILPYPPGVPLVMIGEKITEDSRAILDFLIMLTEIGKYFPCFETDIHGVWKDEDTGEYKTLVITNKY